MLCKMAKSTSEQIKKILAIHENTLMKVSASSMVRLENKFERLSNKNTFLKPEFESLKTGANFHNKWFDEPKRDLEEMKARDPIEEDIKLIEEKQQLEEKMFELEDRSRWNNQPFSGFTMKTGGGETWEESENLTPEFIEENLEMESKDITIVKAHITGSKIKR